MAETEYQTCTLEDGTTIQVKIVYDSLFAKCIGIFGMEAITIWNTIRYYCPKNTLNGTTINHEKQHVRQWHRLGRFKFFTQYWWEQIRHGYNKNKFEQEARQVAGEPLR